ncbi:Ff.00g067710.m01.CDS01 [Fusarium sp. VM40]|nr:Ff.00g067710.m01.CDS01 [Fusarium sp. VM40]
MAGGLSKLGLDFRFQSTRGIPTMAQASEESPESEITFTSEEEDSGDYRNAKLALELTDPMIIRGQGWAGKGNDKNRGRPNKAVPDTMLGYKATYPLVTPLEPSATLVTGWLMLVCL